MKLKTIIDDYLNTLTEPQTTVVVDPETKRTPNSTLNMIIAAAERSIESENDILFHTPDNYALVSAKDAVERGFVTEVRGEKRTHNTGAKLHDDCLQIRGYINAKGMYCKSGSMCTTPLVVILYPYSHGDIIVPGFAVTNSGSIYRLTTLPSSLEEVAESYPDLLRP